MREISLTQGLVAIIDDEDFESISKFTWNAKANYNTFYAATGKKTTYMHRLLCPRLNGMVVDHINGDGLDNRKENLRCASPTINRLNSRISKHNTSGYVGVSLEKRTGRWTSSVRLFGQNIHLGTFSTKEEAALVHDLALIERGYFDGLNF